MSFSLKSLSNFRNPAKPLAERNSFCKLYTNSIKNLKITHKAIYDNNLDCYTNATLISRHTTILYIQGNRNTLM